MALLCHPGLSAVRLATLLGDEQKITEQLAKETNIQEDWVYRVLRYLASYGIYSEVAPRTFANTDLSNSLRSDRSGMYFMAHDGQQAHARDLGQIRGDHENGKAGS